MSAFPCNGCGACCRQVKRIHPEWPTRADGACIHLTADNRCGIYEVRPKICRIGVWRPASVSEDEWNAINLEVCAQLEQEDKRPR